MNAANVPRFWNRITALAILTLVLLAGCAGGPGKITTTLGPSTSAAAPVVTPPPPTLSQVTPSSDVLVPSPGITSLIPTTTTPPTAPLSIGSDQIPEATTGYEFTKATINGVDYATALKIRSSTSPVKLEINSGRAQKRLLGALGIPDDEKSSSSHQVDISLDNGPAILSVVLNFGEQKDIDLDVSGALRVKIVTVSKTTNSGSIAIGNPRFG